MFNHLSFAVGDKVHHAGVWGAMVLRNWYWTGGCVTKTSWVELPPRVLGKMTAQPLIVMARQPKHWGINLYSKMLQTFSMRIPPRKCHR
jgi:hypothetical protein